MVPVSVGVQVQVQNQQRCQLSNLPLTPTATLEVHHPWQLSVCTTKKTKTQTLCLVAPPTTNTVQVQVQNKQGHPFWVTPTHHWHPLLHLRCIIHESSPQTPHKRPKTKTLGLVAPPATSCSTLQVDHSIFVTGTLAVTLVSHSKLEMSLPFLVEWVQQE